MPWKRRAIKNSGKNKHHDQIFGDFDGDGRAELVFWNQGAGNLYMAEIPARPKQAGPWPHAAIYSWQSRPDCEGLAKADIDGDGKLDIIGGAELYTTHIEAISADGSVLSDAEIGILIGESSEK